ncbi:hypothetical protein ADL07_11930 [Streptomyces sp. NRRL F-4707]|nr:hypothetical protein ADL07_11930 [Streptomyces sp. NRRL F-4707]
MMWPMAPRHDEDALQRLASLIIKRRSELDLNKADVARRAGLQVNTYSKAEAGLPVRETTYAKIEPILEWAAGSCLDILSGAAAATLVEPATPAAVFSPVRAEDLAEDVGDVVQDAAVAISNTMTAAEIRELKRQVVEKVLDRWEKRGIDRD